MPLVQVELAVTAGSGTEFEVVCIRPGPANGLQYPPAVLAASTPLWDGVTSFADHADALDRTRAGGRSVRDVCGVIAQPTWDETRGITATLRLTGRAGEELSPLLSGLVHDRDAGLPVPNVGLSADLLITHSQNVVVQIDRVLSVDVVFNPAAGGRLERVLQATPPQTTSVPAGQISDPAPNEPAPIQTPEGEANMPPEPNEHQTPTPAQNSTTDLDEIRAARREMVAAYARTALATSGLPLPMQQAVQARLTERPDSTVADVLHEVEAERTVWAALQEEHTVQHLGAGAAVSGMTSELDRLQLACNRLLGVPGAAAAAGDAPRLSGIRELYLLLTGDYEMRGVFVPERVSLANLTTSSLSSVVKNALNKVLVASFEARPQWWQPIVVEEDFPTLNSVTWITLGGFPDLSDVAEGGDYTELANLTDTEEVSAWKKKGGYIGLTLEMIDRDNVAAVRQIPRKLGLSAWRTLSAGIADLFTANSGVGPYWPSSQIVNRLFCPAYGNLGSTALSAASWDATVQAMYTQTEAGSGKRLGVRPKWLLVPIELEKTALTILTSAGEPGTGNNDANVRAGTFGVITVPEFTDTNDWAAAADPADLPGICLGYRFGRAPELFVADDPVTGSMFTNDEMRLKVRFLYTIGVAEPKALYKHNVT
ncbi:MAG TPA: Mu-like prophage major head subunit gpT family protein [Anaerolineae bacterium]|nr:Mu-like prophage major head subunit gpT family protein [Anaerolineae bacterium]HOR00164.1 Mu-like prophage major head subunit gpT family protein [Anaerolineae bacterium]